ncbi:MAG: hypothetical protein SO044_05520 [Agathobaculum sp.]|uniref:hypothetical protein n=1 Tax=Agathobaculum sp. TaxID=2048138 RepID=UPI0025C3B8E8|nr:hypothetical protein [Agathobaculum sp.]MDY3711857.1 hypothetical protein [Agathobaculum sp.]
MCHVESEQQQVSKIIGTVQTDTAMQQQAAQANQTTTYQLPAHLSWENEFKTKNTIEPLHRSSRTVLTAAALPRAWRLLR